MNKAMATMMCVFLIGWGMAAVVAYIATSMGVRKHNDEKKGEKDGKNKKDNGEN